MTDFWAARETSFLPFLGGGGGWACFSVHFFLWHPGVLYFSYITGNASTNKEKYAISIATCIDKNDQHDEGHGLQCPEHALQRCLDAAAATGL